MTELATQTLLQNLEIVVCDRSYIDFFIVLPSEIRVNSITHQISLAAGLGLIIFAGLANSDWKEFYQYFRESRFVSV